MDETEQGICDFCGEATSVVRKYFQAENIKNIDTNRRNSFIRVCLYCIGGIGEAKENTDDTLQGAADSLHLPIRAMAEDDYNVDLSVSLVNARTARGMTQKQLGEALGVPQPTIARWESGDHNPSHGSLKKIAKALNALAMPPSIKLL